MDDFSLAAKLDFLIALSIGYAVYGGTGAAIGMTLMATFMRFTGKA